MFAEVTELECEDDSRDEESLEDVANVVEFAVEVGLVLFLDFVAEPVEDAKELV